MKLRSGKFVVRPGFLDMEPQRVPDAQTACRLLDLPSDVLFKILRDIQWIFLPQCDPPGTYSLYSVYCSCHVARQAIIPYMQSLKISLTDGSDPAMVQLARFPRAAVLQKLNLHAVTKESIASFFSNKAARERLFNVDELFIHCKEVGIFH